MLDITAGRIMNRQVFTFPASGTLVELAEFLVEKDVSGVLVVDEKDIPVGVISATDITEETADGAEPPGHRPSSFTRSETRGLNPEDLTGLHVEDEGRLARDFMTPTVYTVPENTPVASIARTMVAGRVHRLFVTRAGRVVGIITPLDLVKLLADEKLFSRSGETAAVYASERP